MANTYRMCTRCIMDTTDPDIQFDENGVCNHCRKLERRMQVLLSEEELPAALDCLVKKIKAKGKGKEYDCIIGVSGGVDSTYVAYLVKQLGLRPLAVNMDNGWNSELAVSNIEKALNKLDIDLYTYVLEWEEFKDLQIAFLKASTPDSEIPTDHAIWAVLYQAAAERDIPYVILGDNLVTEGIMPRSWAYGYLDWRYIKSVHREFGKAELEKFPHISLFDWYFYYRFVKRIERIYILSYIPYNKQEVTRIVEEELGWRPYGGKHYESIYTRFLQGYILPRKFNIDKRKAHLSALIMSDQITREEALAEMERPPYAGYEVEEDMEYVLEKLEFTEDEFEEIMSLPLRTHRDYPTHEDYQSLIDLLDGTAVHGMATRLPRPVWLALRRWKRGMQRPLRNV